MADKLVKVTRDPRFDTWKVDAYRWDGEYGAHMHRGVEGEYDLRDEAAPAAEELAAEEGALLRVKDEAGSVVEERCP